MGTGSSQWKNDEEVQELSIVMAMTSTRMPVIQYLFHQSFMIFPRIYHPMPRLILASKSLGRQSLLRCAGVPFEVHAADVDEEGIRRRLLGNGSDPKELAEALAESKARAVARLDTNSVVLGCDQVLEFDGDVLAKPKDRLDARKQLGRMNGQCHRLHSAAVVCEGSKRLWSFTGEAEIEMRRSSGEFLDAYVSRNWPRIADSVGCYKIEEEGIRLFSRIDGDHFTIVGLPLLEVLTYLADRRLIPA